ncbi:MAG: hypothetical protein R8K20_07595 [Gallionellaceae bacterium]
MSVISGVASNNAYTNNVTASRAAGAVTSKENSASSQPKVSQSALESVVATLGNSASTPLTYNASGLFKSPQPAAASSPNTASTSAQAAKDAVFAAENVVTNTLNSLLSGSSADSSSSSSDFLAPFSSPGTSASNSNDPFGSPQSASLNSPNTPSTAGGNTSQTIQEAVVASQNVVTNTLNSLGSASSSSSGL